MITTRTVDFEQAGKTTFIFRTEIEDREQLREHLKDAQSRFKTTQRHYKIRVFETSELITRHGHRQEIFFLTFKLEAVSFRAAALRMSRIFGYLSLLDFGLRSNQQFEIDEKAESVYLFSSQKTISRNGIFRRALVKT